jgi:hypothetical protein
MLADRGLGAGATDGAVVMGAVPLRGDGATVGIDAAAVLGAIEGAGATLYSVIVSCLLFDRGRLGW